MRCWISVWIDSIIVHKAGYTAFNPRLGKEAKLTRFFGQTAQDLTINPITGGYDLSNARSYMEKKQDSIDLTNNISNVDTTLNNEDFKMGIPETSFSRKPKTKNSAQTSQNI